MRRGGALTIDENFNLRVGGRTILGVSCHLIAPRIVRFASPCCTCVDLDLDLPNPSHIDTSRVTMLAIDTGPPPDTVLIDCCDHHRRRHHRRHHHR